MRTRSLSRTGSATRFLSWLLVLGFCAAVAGRALVGLDVHVVLTGSMRPHYAEGSVIVTKLESTRDLRPGQVVVYTPPGHSAPIAHRLVQVSGDPDRPTLVTKGDANPSPDEWHAALVKTRVPIVIGGVPAVGRLLTVGHLARRWLAVGAIALMGLSMTVAQLRRMRRSATCPGCSRRGRGVHRHRPSPTGSRDLLAARNLRAPSLYEFPPVS